MDPAHMREFWDQRAREDAYFFIDNRRRYGDAELSDFWAEGERTIERFLELLAVEIRPGDTVLDIGCGVGRLTRALARRAARVYALDVSSQMIERARRHNSDLDNVEWIVGDGTSLRPLGDASVDASLSHVVFQHLPDPALTLGYVAEMGRVLRPAGWSAFQFSNDASVHARRPRAASALPGRRPAGQDDPAWLGSAVALHALRAVARRSGLELECVIGEGTQFCVALARRVV